MKDESERERVRERVRVSERIGAGLYRLNGEQRDGRSEVCVNRRVRLDFITAANQVHIL